MRSALVSLLALTASFVVLGSAGAAPAQLCPARSVGPGGALPHGSTAGAECILRAYRNGCPTVEYDLSSFGVDTITTLRFQLLKRPGRCLIEVTRIFRVVPQKPRLTAGGECKTLHRSTTGVVAMGCTGSLSPTTSLLR